MVQTPLSPLIIDCVPAANCVLTLTSFALGAKYRKVTLLSLCTSCDSKAGGALRGGCAIAKKEILHATIKSKEYLVEFFFISSVFYFNVFQYWSIDFNYLTLCS